jgi:hypothetical protein
MRPLLLCAAMVTAICSLAAAQDEKKKDEKPVIVVRGCLDGSWLRVQASDSIGAVARYRLHGSRTLLKELTKKYNGHLLEVTGAVTDTGETAHRGKVIPVGKNARIYTGAKEAPAMPAGTGDPILDLASFRELQASCK